MLLSKKLIREPNRKNYSRCQMNESHKTFLRFDRVLIVIGLFFVACHKIQWNMRQRK